MGLTQECSGVLPSLYTRFLERRWLGDKSQPVYLKHQPLEGFPAPRWRYHLLPSSLQKKLRDQRQFIVAEFEQGHQFLREREQHLLGQLARLEQELTEGRDKYSTRGTGEMARLVLAISELEAKAQQPAAELMQVRDHPRAGRQGLGWYVRALPLTGMTLKESFPPGALVSSSETQG